MAHACTRYILQDLSKCSMGADSLQRERKSTLTWLQCCHSSAAYTCFDTKDGLLNRPIRIRILK